MTSIVFMGTPQFSVPILEALVAHDYQVLAVVTQPDRKVGRKQVLQQTPVKEAAVRLNLTVFQPEKLSGSQELADVMALQPDLIVTAAYGQFLPTKLLEAAKIAAINVHGSLLPKYRGGAPIQYAVLNGDSEIGITIMHMAKKMDAGDMIEQASIPIEASDDTGTLFDKLSYVGRDLLLKTLPSIIDQTAPRTPQDEAQVTFAYNITKEQEQLD
ncbi:methionyl-tRNA formyltransferase, partial [Latilactobacillus curvatus]